ncbi:MAG: vWA domain-containing protein [Pseudomonadota bacterium]|nr:vWA domain-containing protein [Pseudomonadota bacterium]
MARRQFNVFNLSFIDIMSCGFGAVVLFFMIISAQVSFRADKADIKLVSDTFRLEEEVFDGRKNLVRLRTIFEKKQQQQISVEDETKQLQLTLEELLEELAQYDSTSLALRESLEKLQSDIERLEEQKKRLMASAQQDADDPGRRIRTYVGEGDRQYLTGLKMGGKRILILVDSSASMLGRTYINVLRYRNMQDEMKILAPKWRNVVGTVDWLTTQIPVGTKFQIMTFNDKAGSVIKDSDNEWLEVTDGSNLTEAMEKLRYVVPQNGTSLYKAFQKINEIKPRPDNVYLLTDGRPTHGRTTPDSPRETDAIDRLGFFDRARKEVPNGVPINILLYPMDGDPHAAAYYWQLAMQTRGSFMTPSEDWP